MKFCLNSRLASAVANRRSWCAAIALALVVLAGCVRRDSSPGQSQEKFKSRPINNLALGIDSVRNMVSTLPENRPGIAFGEFNQSRALYYFNQWIARQELDADNFTPDPLLRGLPAAIRNHPVITQLQAGNQNQIRSSDIAYLQQTLWMNDIATRVGLAPPPSSWKAWLTTQEKAVGVEASQQLRQTLNLFDWTIRGIQLDELPPPPQGPIATAGDAPAALQLPPLRGEPGPGYRQLPLMTLLYGHGDAHERARVFILLCRQLRIPVVVLGLVDPQQSGPPTPWVAAALIGGKLYLFDTALGLPLPGPKGEGVATLDDLAEQPELLRQLDIAGGPQYPVNEKALSDGLVALIDADPDSLSQRMAVLEEPLNKARREARESRSAAGLAEAEAPLFDLVLSTQPSELAASLRKLRRISSVSLWRTPYEAILFQLGRSQKPGPKPAYAGDYRDDELPAALTKARDQQFRGQFESVDQRPGARAKYLYFRRSDLEIDSLETSAEARRMAPGLEERLKLAGSEQEQKQLIKGLVTNTYRVKYRSSYWMALTYLDEQNNAAALEWFRDRAQENKTGDNPWLPSARYNLARCYEEAGLTEEARAIYLADQSPQRHGSLLRAQRLAAQK